MSKQLNEKDHRQVNVRVPLELYERLALESAKRTVSAAREVTKQEVVVEGLTNLLSPPSLHLEFLDYRLTFGWSRAEGKYLAGDTCYSVSTDCLVPVHGLELARKPNNGWRIYDLTQQEPEPPRRKVTMDQLPLDDSRRKVTMEELREIVAATKASLKQGRVQGGEGIDLTDREGVEYAD